VIYLGYDFARQSNGYVNDRIIIYLGGSVLQVTKKKQEVLKDVGMPEYARANDCYAQVMLVVQVLILDGEDAFFC
jgi:hypothetical protein